MRVRQHEQAIPGHHRRRRAGRRRARASSSASAASPASLVERRVGLHNIPKGQNLTSRTLEHFYFWGVVDEMRATRIMPKEVPASRRHRLQDPDERALVRASPGREMTNKYYFQANDRLPQYEMERVLRARMASAAGRRDALGLAARDGRRRTPAACASPSRRKAATRPRCSRPTMRSAATAAIRSCARRSASSAAATTTTS